MSILIGFVYTISVALFMQIFPGIYFIFYNQQSISTRDIIESNPFTVMYMVLPGIATTVNIFCKCFAIYTSAKFEGSVKNTGSKFDFSLGGSILISIQIFAIAISINVDRFYQLRIIFPYLISAHALVLPLYIILTNVRMKRVLKESMSDFLFNVNLLFEFLCRLSY